MHYLEYNEEIEHRTGDLPLAYYYVDKNHPRYQMRMHWHRETEIIIMHQGTLELRTDDTSVVLSAGEAMMIGGGVVHGGEAVEAQYSCIVFDPDALLMHMEACRSAVRENSEKTFYFNQEALQKRDGLRGALERLVRYAAAGSPLKTMGALFETWGWLEDCQDCVTQIDQGRSGCKPEQLKPALEFIEKNYMGRIRLEELARLTGLSSKYFCRCFRAITHFSPIEYINFYRIECASEMLSNTDMSVAEIAQQCGFNDSSFFIKQFRRYKGITPHKYRTKK